MLRSSSCSCGGVFVVQKISGYLIKFPPVIISFGDRYYKLLYLEIAGSLSFSFFFTVSLLLESRANTWYIMLLSGFFPLISLWSWFLPLRRPLEKFYMYTIIVKCIFYFKNWFISYAKCQAWPFARGYNSLAFPQCFPLYFYTFPPRRCLRFLREVFFGGHSSTQVLVSAHPAKKK